MSIHDPFTPAERRLAVLLFCLALLGQLVQLEDRPRVLVDHHHATLPLDHEDAAAHPLDQAAVEVLAGRPREVGNPGARRRHTVCHRSSRQNRTPC